MHTNVTHRLGAGLLLGVLSLPAAAQDTLFASDFGGNRQDGAWAIEATDDGGFIASGFSDTFSPNSGTAGYLVKTDGDGLMLWSDTFELSPYETHGRAVVQVPGGGYAVAGMTGTNGDMDSFLVRYDEQGNQLWYQLYDAGDDDRAHCLAATPDGGFILAGQAWFGDEFFGNYDMYVVKTDADGAVEWTQVFEYADGFGAGQDIAFDIEPVSTGGYIIAGFTQSIVWAGWVLRLDDLGNIVWDRIYDTGYVSDEMTSVEELPDGGFIMGGIYGSGDSDVDLALVRTDPTGEPLWTRLFGGQGHDDQAQCVRRMPDGGFVLAGMISDWQTGWDMIVIRTDENGDEIWRDRHGEESDDRAHSVAVGAGKIVAAGWAWSYGNGLGDMHLVGYSDPALACDADYNGDGAVNTLDVLAFLNAWSSGDPRGDFNEDGTINTLDVLAFLNAWSAGC